MVEKGIRGGICHAVFQHAKANNKYMKEKVKRTFKLIKLKTKSKSRTNIIKIKINKKKPIKKTRLKPNTDKSTI